MNSQLPTFYGTRVAREREVRRVRAAPWRLGVAANLADHTTGLRIAKFEESIFLFQRNTLNINHISKKIKLLCEARAKQNFITICKSILALVCMPNVILYLQSQDKALYTPSSFTGLWPIHVTDVFVGERRTEESAETVAKPAPFFLRSGSM